MSEEKAEETEESPAQDEEKQSEEELKVLEIIRSKKIGVLTGGTSPQRDVSLKSGEAVFNLLQEAECNVVSIDVDKDIATKLREEEIDLAFITTIGKNGCDGSLQGLLEIMGIPYTGSRVLSSATASNKVAAKEVFERYQISTPAWEHVSQKDFRTGYVMMLDLPLVLKPVTGGASIGTQVVFKAYKQDEAMEKVFEADPEALIGERIIDGKLLTVGIIDDITLPVVEIESKNEFYDYESKHEDPEKTTFFIPAKLTKKKQKMAQELALEAHQKLRCQGVTRVDIMFNQIGSPFVLEVNTTPELTEFSPLVMAARAAGIEHKNLVLQIVEMAIQEEVDAALKEIKEKQRKAELEQEPEAVSQ